MKSPRTGVCARPARTRMNLLRRSTAAFRQRSGLCLGRRNKPRGVCVVSGGRDRRECTTRPRASRVKKSERRDCRPEADLWIRHRRKAHEQLAGTHSYVGAETGWLRQAERPRIHFFDKPRYRISSQRLVLRVGASQLFHFSGSPSALICSRVLPAAIACSTMPLVSTSIW